MLLTSFTEMLSGALEGLGQQVRAGKVQDVIVARERSRAEIEKDAHNIRVMSDMGNELAGLLCNEKMWAEIGDVSLATGAKTGEMLMEMGSDLDRVVFGGE